VPVGICLDAYGDSPVNVAVHVRHVSGPFASRLLLTHPQRITQLTVRERNQCMSIKVTFAACVILFLGTRSPGESSESLSSSFLSAESPLVQSSAFVLHFLKELNSSHESSESRCGRPKGLSWRLLCGAFSQPAPEPPTHW